MSGQVAVVGAGVVGRLLAFRLARRGWDVTLYDRGGWESRTACSFAAAGLLAPIAEATAGGDAHLCTVGFRSLELWPELQRQLGASFTLGRTGTLAVVHEPDMGDLTELRERILTRLPNARLQVLDGGAIAQLEPALGAGGFTAGLYFADEGYIQSHEALAALQTAIARDTAVRLCLGTEVLALGPGFVETAAGRARYELVADCRGFGARTDLPSLRGVRGEILEIHAPEVELTRPVRVLHQRYPLYIVPRGNRTYAVGATCIESESLAPVTVKAALELLGAVYSVHPGFRFAHVTGMTANCRPAFADNLPRVLAEPGLVRLNGLYRHGFLLAPLLVEAALKYLSGEELDKDLQSLFAEVA